MDPSTLTKLRSLQLPQLKDLCVTLNMRKTGKKAGILERVISYLQSEEGRKRVPEVLALLAGKVAVNEPVVGKVACVCGSPTRATVQCKRCGTWQHAGCLGPAAAMKLYECPKCQTEQMDPFDIVQEFILLPTLIPQTGTSDCARSFTYMGGKNRDQRSFVQIRCLLLDKTGYTHQWPCEGTISLNGHLIFNAIPQQPSQSRKRKDLPFDLTPYVLTTQHHQLLAYRKREDHSFALSIVLIHRLSATEVLDRFLSEPPLDLDQGRKFVSSFLSDSYDLCTETLRLNLKCPLTQLKPDKPVRGARCKHIQCFDLQSFVMLQEQTKVNRWRCPICKEHCARLVQDLFIQSIIEESKRCEYCELVEFTPAGDYKLIPSPPPRSDDSDSDIPQKRPKLQDAMDIPFESRETHALTWGEFTTGRVTPASLHSSGLYENVAKLVLASVSKLLGGKWDTAQTTIGRGRTAARASLGGAMRTRSSAGSLACPIDVDG